jgi:hypothetical protein
LFSSYVSANDFWMAFSDSLHYGTQKFIPKKRTSDQKIKNGFKMNGKKFIPKAIKNLQTKKRNLWIKSKEYPSTECKINYKKIALKIKSAHNRLINEHENHIVKSNNLGTLYKHVNSRLVHKTGIAPLRSQDGNLVLVDIQKANFTRYLTRCGRTWCQGDCRRRNAWQEFWHTQWAYRAWRRLVLEKAHLS